MNSAFSKSIPITPGTPIKIAAPPDNQLNPNDTPVNAPVRFTIPSVNNPLTDERYALRNVDVAPPLFIPKLCLFLTGYTL